MDRRWTKDVTRYRNRCSKLPHRNQAGTYPDRVLSYLWYKLSWWWSEALGPVIIVVAVVLLTIAGLMVRNSDHHSDTTPANGSTVATSVKP